VVEASKDNPVFYVQYAHARVASLHRRAAEAGLVLPEPDLSLLGTAELSVVKLAAQFPRVVETAATAREPHRIAFYLYDLAAAFHALWNMGNDDPTRRFLLPEEGPLSAARLALADGVAQIIRNGLRVMGVTAVTELS
jgi:arginyl-tRNA synthetase